MQGQGCLEDFRTSCDTGYRFGKVDVAAFREKWGSRIEERKRAGEELGDMVDFLDWRGKRIGREAALQEWKQIQEDPKSAGYEVEGGEGDDMLIWLPQRKQRFRDNVKFQEQEYAEGRDFKGKQLVDESR